MSATWPTATRGTSRARSSAGQSTQLASVRSRIRASEPNKPLRHHDPPPHSPLRAIEQGLDASEHLCYPLQERFALHRGLPVLAGAERRHSPQPLRKTAA